MSSFAFGSESLHRFLVPNVPMLLPDGSEPEEPGVGRLALGIPKTPPRAYDIALVRAQEQWRASVAAKLKQIDRQRKKGSLKNSKKSSYYDQFRSLVTKPENFAAQPSKPKDCEIFAVPRAVWDAEMVREAWVALPGDDLGDGPVEGREYPEEWIQSSLRPILFQDRPKDAPDAWDDFAYAVCKTVRSTLTIMQWADIDFAGDGEEEEDQDDDLAQLPDVDPWADEERAKN